MKKNYLSLLVTSMMAPAASGVTVSLDMPAVGTYASGSVFTTTVMESGATFDISYTLNAFATDVTVAPFINANATLFGVGSTNDPNVGNQRSIDGDDGEQLAVVALGISNFVPGTSGLSIGDISNLQFDTLTIANGVANPDGVSISFSGFGASEDDVTGPASIDLSTLPNFSPTSAAMYLQPDTAASNNRWSVSGLSVSYDVVPEPSFAALLGLGFAGLLLRRRRAQVV